MIVHVNRHVLTANRKHGQRTPPIAVRKTKSAPATYVSEFVAEGKIRVVYSPDKPLPCGATVWIETSATHPRTTFRPGGKDGHVIFRV